MYERVEKLTGGGWNVCSKEVNKIFKEKLKEHLEAEVFLKLFLIIIMRQLYLIVHKILTPVDCAICL